MNVNKTNKTNLSWNLLYLLKKSKWQTRQNVVANGMIAAAIPFSSILDSFFSKHKFQDIMDNYCNVNQF